MLVSFLFATALLSQATQPTGTHAAWRWQRSIVPYAASPAAEQCAVLDAALFAKAAPGLRDVRLVQDGRELAYAIDISQDAADAGNADRSLYEPALIVPAQPSEWAGVAGLNTSRPDHPPGWFFGWSLLPAHVPVERIRLDSVPIGAEFLSLSAAEDGRKGDAEGFEAQLTKARPAAQFTIGANLQQTANVWLGAHGDVARVSSFVLEMRRREICYQPLSASPVTLFFGNPAAPPVHYEFGRYYQPNAMPLLASMQPAQANAAFHEGSAIHAGGARRRVVLFCGACACVIALVLTLAPLLRRKA